MLVGSFCDECIDEAPGCFEEEQAALDLQACHRVNAHVRKWLEA